MFFGETASLERRRPVAIRNRALCICTRALFEKFTEAALRCVLNAQTEAQHFGAKEVECYHLLLGVISADNSPDGFLETGVDIDKCRTATKALLKDSLPNPHDSDVPFSRDTKAVMEAALHLAQVMDVPYVLKEHLLIALMKQDDLFVNQLLASLNLSPDSILSIAKKQIHMELDLDGQKATEPVKEEYKPKRLASVMYKFNPSKNSPTPTLDALSKDLCVEAAQGKIDPMIGRQHELGRVIQILGRKSKNNPILLGEAGVGKTAIVEGLAHCIVTNSAPDGQPLPDFLQNKRVMQLDYALLIAGAKERGELEKRITKVIDEVKKAGDIILTIDEIHTMVSSGSLVSRGGEGGGGLDVANILKPPLARGELQCIGATTLSEFRQYIESDEALARRFQPVMVNEPTPDQTVEVLRGLQAGYESHHRCMYTEEAILGAVKLSKRYILDRFLPDKAIDLIDEAGSRAHIQSYLAKKDLDASESDSGHMLWHELEDILNTKVEMIRDGFYEEAQLLHEREMSLKSKISGKADAGSIVPIVDLEDIEKVVSLWTGIPTEHLTSIEKEKMLTLEDKLSQEVIGQKQAISAVSRAMCRASACIRNPKRPIASFLFCGPTGVGKTELSKVLGDHCFGSRDSIVRLDMSEYMERHNTSKLIGAPPGYVGFGEGGKLTEPIRRNPHSLVLFDEIEKAHPDVFNMLLQILEDGRLTDSQGRTVSFENTVIIMTSNIGSNVIANGNSGRGQIGFVFDDDDQSSTNYNRMVALVHEEMKNYFRPELINRIDEVVVFETLDTSELHDIADIILKSISEQVFAIHGIHIHITLALKEYIVKNGYDAAYGARPLRREITRVIDDTLCDAILGNKFQQGQHVVFDVGSSVGKEVILREIEADEVCIEAQGRKYGDVVLYTNANLTSPTTPQIIIE